MRYSWTLAFLVVFNLTLGLSTMVRAQELIQINEFMAVNDNGLEDEDRDEVDWIEIHNAGMNTVDLEGWYLTDNVNDLTKWAFPEVALAPDAYLVVFASGKNRREPLGVLHTNFKLRGSGEYLGLVSPDGHTVVSEFFPTYPFQASDVSYGLTAKDVEVALVALGAPAKAWVPQDGIMELNTRGSEGLRPWTLENWDDSNWQTGVTGVGYNYPGLIGLDVYMMRYMNRTVYIRIPFEVDDPSVVDTLTLRMRYEDGMISYINGQEVARSNAPAPTAETWNSGASAIRSNEIAVQAVDFSIPQFDLLHVGTNLLAVQGLNYQVGSSDLLIVPELLGMIHHLDTDTLLHYFPNPTPGKPNNAGVEKLRPIIADNVYQPQVPSENRDLFITARIATTFDAVDIALLRYRVMFNSEVTVPLLDDGNNGDGEEGDGVYGARIPAGTFSAGQMVRWYITATDTVGRESRFPAFIDSQNSPQSVSYTHLTLPTKA